MKKSYANLLLVLILTMTACTVQTNVPGTEETGVLTPTLPSPQVGITPAPNIDQAVSTFMDLWQVEDYAAMYNMLADEAQRGISSEDFTARYLDMAAAMTLQFETGIEYEILSSTTNPTSAVASVQVNYNTNYFGTYTRQIDLSWVKENGDWVLDWQEGMIMPDLQGGNRLDAIRQASPRGNIYARDGYPIAAQEDIVALGFTPGNLDRDLISLFYSTMADLTIYQVDELVEMVNESFPNDYIPLGEVPQADVDRKMATLSALSGVYLNYYSSRFYYDGGLAPQTIGHLTYISEENMNAYLRQGYGINERYGSTGIEGQYENVLSGERGATLYLKDPNGQIISVLGEKAASSSQSITTTIDPRLQYLLQQSLGDYRGSIVVIEIDTGKVLAMVSNPQFDPNLFDFNNQNIYYANSPYLEVNDPVFNRAVNGQYPLGSVFKVITMAAALETGVFTEASEIYCGHSIEVCGNTLYDWTFEKEKPPSGDLTLPEGLMRSCNPWFYTIGSELVAQGYPNAIADMARSFGLGQETGIEIAEQPGNIPDVVTSCEMNAQLAIGQGNMTVTPLQVASFMAALGNGGTLYRPTLIEEIAPEGGDPTYTFEPEIIGTLPISETNKNIISEAMRSVISNARGTAHFELATMRYRAYGKTGTATNPFGESHAWFAGYTSVGNESVPDIAVAVILENAGEGSEMAAPVFRRAVSLYFSNYIDYGWVLPWEAYPYIVASMTPIPSNTPIPTNTPLVTDTPEGNNETNETP
jgi:penicillin-binding protein 2